MQTITSSNIFKAVMAVLAICGTEMLVSSSPMHGNSGKNTDFNSDMYDNFAPMGAAMGYQAPSYPSVPGPLESGMLDSSSSAFDDAEEGPSVPLVPRKMKKNIRPPTYPSYDAPDVDIEDPANFDLEAELDDVSPQDDDTLPIDEAADVKPIRSRFRSSSTTADFDNEGEMIPARRYNRYRSRTQPDTDGDAVFGQDNDNDNDDREPVKRKLMF